MIWPHQRGYSFSNRLGASAVRFCTTKAGQTPGDDDPQSDKDRGKTANKTDTESVEYLESETEQKKSLPHFLATEDDVEDYYRAYEKIMSNSTPFGTLLPSFGMPGSQKPPGEDSECKYSHDPPGVSSQNSQGVSTQLGDTRNGHDEITPADKLTHVDSTGKANMVDISVKPSSERTAKAEGWIFLGEKAFSLVQENKIKKGDVLTTAQIAGIMAAKQTSNLIPLCHNINLSQVQIALTPVVERSAIHIVCEARCRGQTGVEMEALTGVSVTALTVYDMCKAVTREMVISDVRLVMKKGGQTGDFVKQEY